MLWTSCFNYLQRQRPIFQCKIVNWKDPDKDWIKVNTDGTSKGNPGLSTYEFCLRNESGNMIYEKPGQLGVATSNVEALAILRALRHCKAQGWDRVILETDSLSLQKINTKEWGIPWEIVQLVNKI